MHAQLRSLFVERMSNSNTGDDSHTMMARPDVALMISSLMTKQSRAVLESCTKMQYHQNRTHAHQGHPKNTHAPHMPPSSTREPTTHAPRKSTHAHTCPARGMCGHVYKFEPWSFSQSLCTLCPGKILQPTNVGLRRGTCRPPRGRLGNFPLPSRFGCEARDPRWNNTRFRF